MGSNRGLWSVIVSFALCLVVVWFSTSWGQGRSNYQPETHVYTTPDYQTDTTRAIDAYERLMARYMDMTERNFGSIAAGMKTLTVKFDAIDAKLTALDTRLARIERHLGITPEPPAGGDPNVPAVLSQRPTPQTILELPVNTK